MIQDALKCKPLLYFTLEPSSEIAQTLRMFLPVAASNVASLIVQITTVITQRNKILFFDWLTGLALRRHGFLCPIVIHYTPTVYGETLAAALHNLIHASGTLFFISTTECTIFPTLF